MRKVEREEVVVIIKNKLIELCKANDMPTDECEERARADEDKMYANPAKRSYVGCVAEYLAIIERCILMGWENDPRKSS